ncbi:MAG: hypothetical protein QOH21_2473 [Acidobacteriota bacterium]|nr:hypothetical protein [Acidobacteriota bacterium]
MRVPAPIFTAHLFAPLDAELLSVLRGLTPEEWHAPTAAGSWTVKDVAAHLLDTALRRLSIQRDGYAPPLPPDAFANGLGGFVNNANAEWVSVARRLSPAILTELLSLYSGQLATFLGTLDPHAPAQWAVSWAGDEQSPAWFDIARELTERWHHQQQIRDAVGRAPLYDPVYFVPIIDTFVRALPFAYRQVDAPSGTSIALHVPEAGAWLLVREGTEWTLYAEEGPATTTITLPGDAAWRLFTKGLTAAQATARATIEGDAAHAEALLRMVCIVA